MGNEGLKFFLDLLFELAWLSFFSGVKSEDTKC